MTKTLQSKNDPMKIIYNVLMLTFVMFTFLVSLKLMGGSFKLFGNEAAHEIINATSNPFVSLFIGLLATAIIQSSSTTTSMVVAMVAAGTLTIENAVPMIMGANIGTSVTSSIVSLGHIGNKREYKKAISAATVHDFFNIMVVLLLFPLEYFFGFLSGMAGMIAGMFSAGSSESEKMFSILGVTVKPTAKYIMSLLNKNAWLCLLAALGLLFFSLRYLTVLLKKLLIGKAESKLDKLIFNKPMKALGWGTVLTMAVQSSSVTTSLIVPMVASNKVSLRKAFPFLMGANIGTTVTALIAAMSTEASVFEAALTIALAHVLFNVLGATILFPIKFLREIPVKLSRKLGKATMKNRLVGMAYIVITFFLIPFLLIMVSGGSKSTMLDYKFSNKNLISGSTSYTVIEDQIDTDKGIRNRKIFSDLESPEYTTDQEATNSKTISNSDKTISIGEDLYILSDPGFCFDREELKGKVELCVKDIQAKIKINNKDFGECYIYEKTYNNLELVDSISEKLYLDITNKLIIKKETFDKSGKLINIEEII